LELTFSRCGIGIVFKIDQINPTAACRVAGRGQRVSAAKLEGQKHREEKRYAGRG
jgi:hypothetical protein